MPTIIVQDALTTPPTWMASFRDVTLYCDMFFGLPVVIESDDPDPFYRWLKPMGCMDFVKDFVRPGSEQGVIVANRRLRPGPFILTDRIVPENAHRLIAQIRGYAPNPK
ncbi:MAG: hypothetical protein Q8L64_04045 [bacterium]|nr:hypothetical protein [bacterium]